MSPYTLLYFSNYANISEILTTLPSSNDFFAAIAINTGCNPSLPFTSGSLSSKIDSTKSIVSSINASL